MTAPAPRGTDPRVEALVAYLCGHDFENVGEDHARSVRDLAPGVARAVLAALAGGPDGE